MAAPDENGRDRINELYFKAMALPSRSGTVKQLADAMKVLIALEREAFGIDEKERKEDHCRRHDVGCGAGDSDDNGRTGR